MARLVVSATTVQMVLSTHKMASICYCTS